MVNDNKIYKKFDRLLELLGIILDIYYENIKFKNKIDSIIFEELEKLKKLQFDVTQKSIKYEDLCYNITNILNGIIKRIYSTEINIVPNERLIKYTTRYIIALYKYVYYVLSGLKSKNIYIILSNKIMESISLEIIQIVEIDKNKIYQDKLNKLKNKLEIKLNIKN